MRSPNRIIQGIDPRSQLLHVDWGRCAKALQALPDDDSQAGIHRTRVNLRRLRALLKAVKHEAHPVQYKGLQHDLANLHRHLAQVRTADAYADLIEALFADCPNTSQKDRIALQRLLQRSADGARKLLRRQIHSTSWTARLKRIEAALLDPELLLHPIRPRDALFRAMLLNRTSYLLHGLDKPGKRQLHRQRIRVKDLRYVGEALIPELHIETQRLLRILQRAQDTLGSVHDLVLLKEWLRTAPLPDAPLAALLECIDRETSRQRKRYKKFRPQLLTHLRALKRTLKKSADGR